VGARFGHPSAGVRIGYQVEEPSQQSETVALAKTESDGMGSKLIGEGAGVIEDRTNRVDNKLRDRLRILVVRILVILVILVCPRDPRGGLRRSGTTSSRGARGGRPRLPVCGRAAGI
jgi:hypothetical protein